MQRLESAVKSKALELLNNQTVNRVLGWTKGEFCYDVSPAVFYSEKDLENFVNQQICLLLLVL